MARRCHPGFTPGATQWHPKGCPRPGQAGGLPLHGWDCRGGPPWPPCLVSGLVLPPRPFSPVGRERGRGGEGSSPEPRVHTRGYPMAPYRVRNKAREQGRHRGLPLHGWDCSGGPPWPPCLVSGLVLPPRPFSPVGRERGRGGEGSSPEPRVHTRGYPMAPYRVRNKAREQGRHRGLPLHGWDCSGGPYRESVVYAPTGISVWVLTVPSGQRTVTFSTVVASPSPKRTRGSWAEV